jgi:hypothetical protein
MSSRFLGVQRISVFSLCLGVAGWLVTTSNALAIVDARSQTNTHAPSDGVPWNNVAQIGTSSGVYLGTSWVLTAAHVGAQNVVLNGNTYLYDGTIYRLTNSDSSPADLVLFHLQTAPSLPSLPLTSTTPAARSTIELIANGRIAGSAESDFGVFRGFALSVSGAKSWGNNLVNLGGLTTLDVGAGQTTIFTCDFTDPRTPGLAGATSQEAQVVAGDSGGGVFQLSGSTWQLVGIISADGTFTTQPAGTAVYGDESYFADMATYRPQILALLGGGPVPNLTISRSGGNILVCWPNDGTNYTLEESLTLPSPSWSTSSAPRSVVSGQVCATVPATGSTRFFRLRR